jgi:GxxExxY protein
MAREIYYKQLSYQIIGAAFTVHSRLGCGLPEHCYQRALELELNNRDIPFSAQRRFPVTYDELDVGYFITDLIIDSKIILELKSDERITLNHEAQLFTYLHVTSLKVGYVLNFGVKHMQFKRLIL